MFGPCKALAQGTSFLLVLALYFCYCSAKTKVNEEASGLPSGQERYPRGGGSWKFALCHMHTDISKYGGVELVSFFTKRVLLYMHTCFTTYFLTLTVGVGHLSILPLLVYLIFFTTASLDSIVWNSLLNQTPNHGHLDCIQFAPLKLHYSFVY